MYNEIRALTVGPGIEIRDEEAGAQFDTRIEAPISRIMPGLHIVQNESTCCIGLESPVVGGPVVVANNAGQHFVVPGEFVEYEKPLVVFIAQKPLIQMIIIGDQG